MNIETNPSAHTVAGTFFELPAICVIDATITQDGRLATDRPGIVLSAAQRKGLE